MCDRRSWEPWDEPGIAKKIDAYWMRDKEVLHRKKIAEDVRDKLGLNVPILEMGCGSGRVAQELFEIGVTDVASYTGGDNGKAMLALARVRLPNAKLCELDVLNLGQGMVAQNVLCVHVIQHLPYYKKAIEGLLGVATESLYVVAWFGLRDEIVADDDRWWGAGKPCYENLYNLDTFVRFGLSQHCVYRADITPLSGKVWSVCFRKRTDG